MVATPLQRLVVIGNGMAGCRAVEEVLARDPAVYRITIFGAEPRVNYNRIMLSPVLAGEKTFEDIVINDAAWYADNGITLVAGDPVVAIDRAARTVTAASGRVEPYDRLLLATGSDPFIIPVPGASLPGVVTFRDLDDVDKMLRAADAGGQAVVIGGGLLGLEAAHGLSLRGMGVTVIHLMPTLMERQLDEAAGYLLKTELERRGQTILTGADTAEILERNGRVAGVRLKDGREISADLVVMAVGIRPATALAKSAGLAVERGIVVDDHMVTSDPAILAVGECVQHRGACYGLVAPLWEMCRAAADMAVGRPGAGFAGSVTSTKLKVSGIDLFSAGDFSGGADCEDIVMRDAARGLYKRVVVQGGRVVGAVLYGDTSDGAWYFDLLKRGAEIADMREKLIFGQAHALSGGAAADPLAAMAALPDDAEVCGCNGVSKGTVMATIAGGACSLDAVRSQCKASASCGSCTGLVEQLLALSLGENVQSGPKTMCKCTTFTHADVRRLIVEREFKLIPQVMQELNWSTPDGCASCRPALNYYLLCALPGTYQDDQQSRFVNERLHANIQKDGTYSVVPRMWGGMTNPGELRAIADATEKYGRMVKVTGGQRLDIFGVKKEDLPKIWADLNAAGMVSGHAYGKSLRTVKTCVGSEWCRFGTQDSTGLGIRIEHMTWGSWMPHKFKIAVSGCPRNCAEATIKDFGVICVDSGYELHVGGNGGIHVRATDLLCKVTTEAEAMQVCAAFVQLYREEAWYLERTAPWIERVGLAHIKASLFDAPDAVERLAARFAYSQKFSQDDPWARRVGGEDAELHQHLGEFRPFPTPALLEAAE
ncbi:MULTISPECIES: nitrite reductase large subunit NirB [unclassified Novosphingobium]|uniref:nitrite reductase large subunit NirB n=1 Tax=unclassified Novosphingobium TaxID=2644732 RepID=UPI00146A9B40|nr:MULTISPECIES: nitrite reductase large subunit NirB [unclassified Novosphingobium]NMN05323.1 nitrite reductase (NADH) large subunit [Novosphingobium sp. SG919]NMN87618.1 nitrite reductase (NADH) large subunit [Novosphingobium sp. SG916]